jgi:hypothetical protein
LFIDNAVAVGGAHYDSDFMRSIKTNCVIIPDTDWKRNKEVAQQLNKAIKQGFKVCFMPDTVKGKDINDIVKNGIMEKELVRLIDDNVRSGLAASLEFAINRKCKMEKNT